MTAAIAVCVMLSGAWYTPGTSTPGLLMQDVNGTALAVGQQVKIVGVITAINPGAGHEDNITVIASYPSGPSVLNPAAGKVFTVHPQNLVVGN